MLARSNCIRINDKFVKCLSLIQDRNIASMILLDNSIVSFYCNINNGIYIPSFKGNLEDNELKKIENFLIEIKNCEDVRIEIKRKYQIEQLFYSFCK